MAQLSDDCFAHGGKLMTTAEALALLADKAVAITEPEAVPLGEALGRILAEDITAAHDVPPQNNSAVDGYAVYFDDLDPEAETRLPLGARIAAGHPSDTPVPRGTAARIFTGAQMPPGPDTVMMQEDCREEDGAVVVSPGIKRGANRRLRGEDITAGARVLEAGLRLRPQDLGQAAAAGCRELLVSARLRVALFSTGDELREPGQALDPGAIYDSNRFTLIGLLKGLGCQVRDLGILADDPAAVETALRQAAAEHDLLMTSGGVSVGEEDHVKQVVEALGHLHLWRLAIKPGRPIAFGQVGTVPFVGLPGNPVAVMVTFMNLVRPMILGLMGARAPAPQRFPVRSGFGHRKKKDRREWLRVRLEGDGEGGWIAQKFPREGAGILSSMVESDGLVELPEDVTELAPGTLVDFLPFSEVS